MARKSKIKPGDVYEDASRHPCLCLGASEDGRDIWGISLVDGSYPRSCDPELQRTRKLSLDEAWAWREHGPQDLPGGRVLLPDQQWWWPKPSEGVNPGHVAEHLFSYSLLFLRSQRHVCDRIGGTPLGWWEASCHLADDGAAGDARASYVTRGERASARVEVVAEKEGRLWPIQRIAVEFSDGKLEFSGEAVRGCGRAS